MSSLLEEIQPEDINDAELISYLIYIEQVEKGGRKVKFKDLDLYMEYGKTYVTFFPRFIRFFNWLNQPIMRFYCLTIGTLSTITMTILCRFIAVTT